MKTQEWRFRDKTAWGFGPWMEEPDKLQWSDPTTRIPCLIVRNELGGLCGYAGVASGHPLFMIDYGACSNKPPCVNESGYNPYCDHSPESLLEAHGGITFAGLCRKDKKEHGICHIPGPGEPEVVWWFGFDCGHYQDFLPGMDRIIANALGVYRDLSYVKAQVTNLAGQLAKLQPVAGKSKLLLTNPGPRKLDIED